MSAHTPGPWEAGLPGEADRITADDGTKYHRRRTVAWVATHDAYRDMNNEMAQGDARLIAAAPELLEACEEMLSAIESLAANGEAVTRFYGWRAIIAKAKGQ